MDDKRLNRIETDARKGQAYVYHQDALDLVAEIRRLRETLAPGVPTVEEIKEAVKRGADSAKELDERLRRVFGNPDNELRLY